ncbi:MAG TPA: hypothetical protein VG891_03375 [Rhizomicrobium sp.]|jgi:hypothetical protein|nr:hypothetical protein [Rhizomicrobium sp.]
MSVTRAIVLVGVSLAVAGCVAGRAKDTAAYRESVMHSNSYRVGYNDGCQVANYTWARQQQGRNRETFEKDSDYREGFLTGTQNCKDTVFMVNTGKPNDHLNGLF